jgi:hypothetical protein
MACCLEELDRYAYLERILPTHRNTVMQAVLCAMGRLQLAGLCSFPIQGYSEYLQYGNYVEVRVAAARVLLDLFPDQAIPLLVQLVSTDESKTFRRALAILLAQRLTVEHLADDSVKAGLYDLVSAGSVHCDVVRRLAERLYPISVGSDGAGPSTTTTGASTETTIIIQSPRKQQQQPVEEADWMAEISEGQPHQQTQPAVSTVASSRRDTTSFTQPAQPITATAVPKLRLAINTTTQCKDKCRAVIDELWEHPDSYPFRHPVDPTVPHYYDIIRSPMDLTSLRQQCATFTSPQHFLQALRLVFDNCFQFNHPQSMIYAQAKELRKQAVKEAKKQFAELKGSIRDLLCADLPIGYGGSSVGSVSGTITTASTINTARPERFEREEVCRKVLLRLMQMPQSFWFLHPVDPVALHIPTYFDVIKEPMDLGTVSGKLESGMYQSVTGFLRDVKLVFANCFRFNNVGDPVSADARVLERVVEAEFGADCYGGIDVVSSGASYSSLVQTAPVVQVVPPQPTMQQQPVLKIKLAPVKRDFEEPCRSLLDALLADDQSGPFSKPVVGVPSYSKVIRHPMDLSTVDAKLKKHAYISAAQFKADLDLIWANCYRFNGAEAQISEMARHLSDLAQHLFNELGL